MPTGPLYSERRNGPPARTVETVSLQVKDALVSLAQRKIQLNWLAQEYPSICQDGEGIAGTDIEALQNDLAVRVGGGWPLTGYSFDDSSLYDLLEFVASRAALPVLGKEHTFLKHHELTFRTAAGQANFRKEVNDLFRVAGLAYEMTPNLQIERLAAPETERIMDALRPNTSDATLDDLIAEGRNLFRSRDANERQRALEKLWDGFERLKSVDVPEDKKSSVQALLAHIADDELRDVVEEEMRALTKIGNEFQIRHWEAGKHPVSDEAVEYLAARVANVIVLLLRCSDRLTAS